MSWCDPCKKMEREAFSDPVIKEVLKDYVLLRMNFDNQISLHIKYGVRAIPYVFITDSHGRVIDKQKGYSGKNNIERLLSTYNLSTSCWIQCCNATNRY